MMQHVAITPAKRPRSPYATLPRERARIYLRDCLEMGREPRPGEMVRRGIGANWKSAQRLLAWAVERI